MKRLLKTIHIRTQDRLIIAVVICLCICAGDKSTFAQQDKPNEEFSSRRNSPQIITFEQMQLEQEARSQRKIERQQAIEQQLLEEKQLALRRQIEQERIEVQQAEVARLHDRKLEQMRLRQIAQQEKPSNQSEPKRLVVSADKSTFVQHSSVEPRIAPVQYEFQIKPQSVLDGQQSTEPQTEEEVDDPIESPASQLPLPATTTLPTPDSPAIPAIPEMPKTPGKIELTPFLPTPETPLPNRESVSNDEPRKADNSDTSSTRRSQTENSNDFQGNTVSQTPAPIVVDPPTTRESSNTSVPVATQEQEEKLPEPAGTFEISSPKVDGVEITSDNGLVTIIARDALLSDILNLLSEKEDLSFVHSTTITDRVSIALRNIPLENALTAVLSISGYSWSENNGVIYVTSLIDSTPMVPEVSGREVRVFHLDYADPTEVSLVVSGMISKVGKSFITKSDPRDNRRTGQSIVVEDLPGSLARVEQYIGEVDVPPRQVLIEAYVMQVDLSENDKHGVNFQNLAKVGTNTIRFGTNGSDTATGNSTGYVSFQSQNLTALIDALKTTTNATTLASPKLLAVNGQESRLQVGQQLGFRVATTTQTSTIEDVRFLEVGVLLSVTPQISRDGRIMLKVRPKVSSGQVNPDTGLPEEDTSEVETSVLLDDGRGMIIGGLIQEVDAVIQSKVPILGEVPVVKHLFRNVQNNKGRREIIFVLLPRIVDYNLNMEEVDCQNVAQSISRERGEYDRSTGPLLNNCLVPSEKRAGVTPQYHDRFTCPDGNCQIYHDDMQSYPAGNVLEQPMAPSTNSVAPAEDYSREADSANAVPLAREFLQPIQDQPVMSNQPVANRATNNRSSAHQQQPHHQHAHYQQSTQNRQTQQQQTTHQQTIQPVSGQRTRQRKSATDQQQQQIRQQQYQSQQYHAQQQLRQQTTYQGYAQAQPTEQQNVQPSSRTTIPQTNRKQFNLQRYAR